MVNWIKPQNSEAVAYKKELLLQFINAEKLIKLKGEQFITATKSVVPNNVPDIVPDIVPSNVDEWINVDDKIVNVGAIKLNIPLDKRLQSGKTFNKMQFT